MANPLNGRISASHELRSVRATSTRKTWQEQPCAVSTGDLDRSRQGPTPNAVGGQPKLARCQRLFDGLSHESLVL